MDNFQLSLKVRILFRRTRILHTNCDNKTLASFSYIVQSWILTPEKLNIKKYEWLKYSS